MKPVSRTAFYCCGVRMRDAESASPVCGDNYARLFMNEDALQLLEAFKDDQGPNAGNVARHRIIDDLLRRELQADPTARVVIIGAGFDTRAYRLEGGSWVELDEPQVIAYKNERLPVAESRNELTRIAVDFSNESLEEKLAPFARDGHVVVVVEGVLMYLHEPEIRELLHALRRLFPQHKLICDLMNRAFFENYARPIHGKIAELGAPFKFIEDDPAAIFLESDYRQASKISIVETSVEYAYPGASKEDFDAIRPTLPQGYDIYLFEL